MLRSNKPRPWLPRATAHGRDRTGTTERRSPPESPQRNGLFQRVTHQTHFKCLTWDETKRAWEELFLARDYTESRQLPQVQPRASATPRGGICPAPLRQPRPSGRPPRRLARGLRALPGAGCPQQSARRPLQPRTSEPVSVARRLSATSHRLLLPCARASCPQDALGHGGLCLEGAMAASAGAAEHPSLWESTPSS